MKAENLILSVLFLLSLTSVQAQDTLESDCFSIQLNPHGQILHYCSYHNGEQVDWSFRQDQYAGFAFEGITLKKNSQRGPYYYEAFQDGIQYHLEYSVERDRLKVKAGLYNGNSTTFLPTEGVKLFTGINTYMEKYPEWNQILFPTMQRCERTHFLSYFMTPDGNSLVLTSPDPIASWSNEYETREKKTDKGTIELGLHRIFTTSVYLLHRLPLPERHPQHLSSLAPGEEKEVVFYLETTRNLRMIPEIMHNMTNAPILSAAVYTLGQGSTFHGELRVSQPLRVEIRTPRDEVHEVCLTQEEEGKFKWTYLPTSGIGEYTMQVWDREGHLSEMKLYVRPNCQDYLEWARKEGLRSRPTSTHHAECFYPFYTYFLAQKYVPQEQEDLEATHVFDSLFPVLYDREAGEMRNGKARIQDAATMAGILCDRYQVTGEEDDLLQASRLVDYLFSCQGKNGALYTPDKHIHYSSVIYPLKSIIEVIDQEMKQNSEQWKKKARRHQKKVGLALDELASSGDNIGTEGQITFEDGMISCSITQLALAALKFPHSRQSSAYLQQALQLYEKHRCLTQNLIPDCRMNGATLRFWEYQYAVNLLHNAMNSPCGWSAWKLYGCWYLYLLTGEVSFFKDFLNGIGSAMQLIDAKTGELRFSFMPDPYLDTWQFTETPVGSRIPILNRIIVGEQYISQTSSWHHSDPYAWRPTKFGIDNAVHEVFKCMSETLLENAYLIEDEEGMHGINCRVEKEGDIFVVYFTEPNVRYLHVNLLQHHLFKIDSKIYEATAGYRWLSDIPDAVRAY